MLSFQYNTIKFYEISPIKNEGSPLLAQNKVQADLFSGSLAVWNFRGEAVHFCPASPSRAKRGGQLALAKSFLAVCVRKNSNRFRPKFVGRAEFPPTPPSARPRKRPFRIGRFRVFRSAFSGTPNLARFGGKFFLNF